MCSCTEPFGKSYSTLSAINLRWYASKSISTNTPFLNLLINFFLLPSFLFNAAKLIPPNLFDGRPVEVYKLYSLNTLPSVVIKPFFSINERLFNISSLYDTLTGCSLFSIISMSVFTIDLHFSICFKTGITLFIFGFL